ncbi:MAG: hypothetical protein M1831_007300 [Alyxoria varia]|nr:MAG: hypothetical protein M1831_007300 [Alyxoria varia]
MDQQGVEGAQGSRGASGAQQSQNTSKKSLMYEVGKEGHYGACQQIASSGGAPDSSGFVGPWTNVNQGLSGQYSDVLTTYWKSTLLRLEEEDHDYKVHQLPLARIKKVMKADPDVKMISAEAPLLFAKGCEIFITELTMRAWIHAEENKRRTLQRSDIASALMKSDMFDFLIDIVPREEATSQHAKRPSTNTGPQGQGAPPQQSQQVPQQQPMPPQAQPQQPQPPPQHAPPEYGGFPPQHMPHEQDFRPGPPMYVSPGQDPSQYPHAQPPIFDQSMYQYAMPPQQTSELIDELSLYDVVNTPGVTADLSHISSIPKIDGYLPADDGMKKAFAGADLVIIPAGIPRKPGMTRDDLFKINASIVRDLVQGVADNCPKAFVLVISNPVNSTVPIAAEVLKKAGVFDAKRLFGVTTLDVVRAETFVAEITGAKDPSKTVIPVVGGHSGETIVPLFSQAKPAVDVPGDKLDTLVNRVQFGGDEVVKAKDGAGSATLSMAFAGYRFAVQVIKAVRGEGSIVEPTFVYLPGVAGGDAIAKETGCDYFSVPVALDASGAKNANNVLGSANDYEKKLLAKAIEGLKGNIEKGVEFVKNPPPKSRLCLEGAAQMTMRSVPNIAITGTPGVGKSSLAKRVVDLFNSRVVKPSTNGATPSPHNHSIKLLDLGKEAETRGLRDSYDDELKTWIIDEVLLADNLAPELSIDGGCVMDWMHADFWLPEDENTLNPGNDDEDYHPPSEEALAQCPLDLVVTLRASNTTLYDRYKARDPEGREYTDAKVQQNLDAEIFNEIGEANAQAFGRDSLDQRDHNRVVVHVELTSDTPKDMEENVAGVVDWIGRWHSRFNQSKVSTEDQTQNGTVSAKKGMKRKYVSYSHE